MCVCDNVLFPKADTVEMERLQLELRKLQKEKEILSLDLQ